MIVVFVALLPAPSWLEAIAFGRTLCCDLIRLQPCVEIGTRTFDDVPAPIENVCEPSVSTRLLEPCLTECAVFSVSLPAQPPEVPPGQLTLTDASRSEPTLSVCRGTVAPVN